MFFKEPFLVFFLIFLHIWPTENDVRAKCYTFLPELDFNLVVNYLFVFEVVFCERAKLICAKKISVLKPFLKIRRNFKIPRFPKISEMALFIQLATLNANLRMTVLLANKGFFWTILQSFKKVRQRGGLSRSIDGPLRDQNWKSSY